MNRYILDLFSLVVEAATVAHGKQTRKGNGTPYITHPFTVALLLLQAGCSEETVAAGLLHDTVEDTNLSFEEIVHKFGQQIARVVRECSEYDKSKGWEERKQHKIDHLHTVSLEACMVMCADKLHNIRATVREFEAKGDDVWGRFNRGKEKQEWYYRSVVDVLGKRVPDFPLYSLLKQEVDELFR
jgi:(p)ppGpp synthase/HD superfamily hydrolase